MGIGISAKDFDTDTIDPMLDRLKAEIIPALQAGIRAEVNNLMLQQTNLISAAILGVEATEDKAAHDIAPFARMADQITTFLAALNGGASVEVRLKPKE
jgi:hypothetical protein